METQLTDLDRIAYLFIRLLNKIGHGLESNRPNALLNSSQVRILLLLNMEGPQRMTQIAEFCDISLSSATAVVNKLHAAQFIGRHEDPRDRRATVVELRPAGHEVIERVNRILQHRVDELLNHLTADKKDEFYAAADRMHGLLQEMLSPNH